MVRVSWIKTGSTFRRMEGDITNLETLKDGVYEIGLDMNGWFLTKTAERFVFDYKIYDLQRGFIDHVIKTYNSTSGNLGVLFNGTRGTGKTVSAKVLANELGLPVILVKSMGENNDSLISYLSSFNFDCIFFFDEFEKQFSERDCSILQIMDGVYNSDFRKVFLLTTNELSVNENLLSRPSRIRYVREFGNLDKSVVEEFLDDNLNDKTNREDLIAYIDTLTISTIDILKAIVEEVNIHGISKFLETKRSFNVQVATYNYRTTLGYLSLSTLHDRNYKIADFLRELKSWESRYTSEDLYRAQVAAAKTDEERERIEEAYEELTRRTANFTFSYIDSVEKAWNRFKEGDTGFGRYPGEETVIAVDVDHHVVVTTYDEYVYFYYVENPSEKPSLYGTNRTSYRLAL